MPDYLSQPQNSSGQETSSASDPQYKMGIGQRILGMIANFGTGMRGKGPLIYTGKGALNSRYSTDLQNYRDNQARQNQKPDLQSLPPASPFNLSGSLQNSFNLPARLTTKPYRMGDVVQFRGVPHVIRAVKPDGSLDITPTSNG